MKPRTKLQCLIAELSSKLPKLTDKQIKWAIDKTVEHPGLRTKKKIICTECGASFPDTMKLEDGEVDSCPHCDAKLTIETTRKRTGKEIQYFNITTTCKGWQVIRFFIIKRSCKEAQVAHYFIDEVIQQWMKPDSKLVTIAKPRLMNSMYINEMWSHSGNLEIRHYDDAYNVPVNATYPIMRLLPEWKKYGFTKAIPQISIFALLSSLQYNTKTETLLKAKQYALLRYAVSGYYSYKIQRNWSSIKICMRNKYIIKDASLWFDYLNLLNHFRKDLHNAHYVCPKNLKDAHDFYMAKKRKEDAKLERERNMKKLLEQKKFEETFIRLKSKFFDLNLFDGKIAIVVLKSLEEFKQEGEAMKHCVFTNNYICKKDSLILSARIDEQRIETIEVSLKNFDIIQSRGACNQNTLYHERIINLVKSNMDLIRKKQHHERTTKITDKTKRRTTKKKLRQSQ